MIPGEYCESAMRNNSNFFNHSTVNVEKETFY